MTRRGFFLTNIGRVAIRASTGPFELFELFFDRYGLWIGSFSAVLMAGSAGRNRHVRRQSAQRTRTGDVDVTGSALLDVLTFAAFVAEPG